MYDVIGLYWQKFFFLLGRLSRPTVFRYIEAPKAIIDLLSSLSKRTLGLIVHLLELTVSHRDDTIGPLDGVRTMRDDNCGYIHEKPNKTIQHQLFSMGIQCGRTLVEYQNSGVLKQRAS